MFHPCDSRIFTLNIFLLFLSLVLDSARGGYNLSDMTGTQFLPCKAKTPLNARGARSS